MAVCPELMYYLGQQKWRTKSKKRQSKKLEIAWINEKFEKKGFHRREKNSPVKKTSTATKPLLASAMGE